MRLTCSQPIVLAAGVSFSSAVAIETAFILVLNTLFCFSSALHIFTSFFCFL